jgi:5'-3' exonuclease
VQALIDGDIVVYRSAFAAEHTYYLLYDTSRGEGPVDWPLIERFNSAKEYKDYIAEHGLTDFAISKEREVEPVENVLYSIKHTLKRLKTECKADSMRIFLSSGECFRHKKATLAKYKGNRDNTPRPVHYQAARDYLVDVHGAEVCTSIEADDALAMNQTKDTVICSIDKDLLQIEGKHYNWVREEKTLVKPRAALCRLWEQVLTGDGTDNIPGIKGLGPARAKKLIAECKGMMEMRKLCIEKWAEALAKEDGVQLLTERDNSKIRPSEVVDEIYMLVKVGGKHAEEALREQTEGASKAD